MSGLKVVALISGGKDSFFSILHCLANGHDVVALANLHPAVDHGERPEDIDSFMYQTVGHSVIPLYAKALGLPLYRQEILGSAVDSNKSYAAPCQAGRDTAASSDETESLLPLLTKVMAAHPEVNAVSTGAILSDYQRTRVESVAIRLGLIPLSYLWQYMFLPPYSETSLLDDMAVMGQDARIIKVASGGLDDSFLWENVASTRTKTRLVKAMQRFGTLGDGAAVGEGGEFETLAIDGPWPLWKSAIEVDPADQEVSIGDAGVASLKLRNARLVGKETARSVTMATVLERLRKPTKLDDKFAEIHSQMDQEPGVHVVDQSTAAGGVVEFSAAWKSRKSGNSIILSNCIGRGATSDEQMRDIMAQIVDSAGIKPSSIAFTTILLRDMADFATINAVYGAVFLAPSPPARVTIACGNILPSDVKVSLSVIALNETALEARQGLHVQSRSYWAPANIGPYSQAISVPAKAKDGCCTKPATIYVAGQIPLAPAVMDFPQAGLSSPEEHFKEQAVLALQHLWRIGQITNVSLWLGAVAFVSAKSKVPAASRVEIATRAWNLAHTPSDIADSSDQEDEDIDLWERAHGHYQSHSASGTGAGTQTKRPDIQDSVIPPCFVAEVEELPKGAPIEWASIGSTPLKLSYSVRGNCFALFLGPCANTRPEQRFAYSTVQTIEAKGTTDSNKLASWVCLRDLEGIKDGLSPADVGLIPDEDGHCTIYTTQTLPLDLTAWSDPQIIPCYRIWDATGTAIPAVIAYRPS